jgi:mono/diheme cytochrome c family protein
MKTHIRHITTTGVVLGALAIGAGIFIWSGMYNIGADEPHWMPTMMAIDNLREHSIATRMADVQIPNLDDPARLTEGVEHYSAMCTGCHLAPGITDSEMRPGLYPMPPDLTKVGSKDPKRTFWIIKHGIKMSAMPAWGKSHTDDQIWNMVAFIRKMPGMTQAQYIALGGKAAEPDEDHDHAHAGADEGHGAMPGMDMGEGDHSHGNDTTGADLHPATGTPAATVTPAVPTDVTQPDEHEHHHHHHH